ncbi:MAG: hypothetical protein HS113_13655 [Verrucomicrobiales bacterium]|nr:hypothetical protein [Verrucomicrobiales bacterium]
MQEQQRTRSELRPAAGPGPQPAAGAAPLTEMAQQASALAAASQAVINAALSGDSQAFLRATRQAGGQ